MTLLLLLVVFVLACSYGVASSFIHYLVNSLFVYEISN